MPFELDHVFIAASFEAPEARALIDAGFVEGESHDHPGQGTASRGIFFENAFLEFIWVTDPVAAKSPRIRRTHLAQRADPAQAACPFGFGLRSPEDPIPDAPFRTWRYGPPYLPHGASFAMGRNSENLDEPLLFVLPWSRTAPFDVPTHSNGARRMTRVGLVQRPGANSDDLEAFFALGLVSLDVGPEPRLRVELDGGRAGRHVDLRPSLPLVVQW